MATVLTVPPKTAQVFPPTKIYYPESDGKPMAETDMHADLLIDLRTALTDYFRDAPDVYVSGNLLLYFEEGDPTSSVAPDVFVVKGVTKRKRRVYKVWEEGKAPDWVIEITSRSTRAEDLGIKRGLYALLNVTEYFIFDPLQEYLKPRLQGYRLHKDNYLPIAPDAQGKFHSVILNLDLQTVNNELRLYDPRTNHYLLTPLEAQALARVETATRQNAEAEVARLRAELQRLSKEQK